MTRGSHPVKKHGPSRARDGRAVEFEGVSKAFRDVRALRELTFSVDFGECVALVGPNGAGKTTTFRILTSLIRDFAGSARIEGVDVRRRSGPVGALIETPALYPYMTVEQNLHYLSDGSNIPRELAGRALEALNLAEVVRRSAGTLSQGMRQRLGLAIALLSQSNVLVLDEPFTALDPPAQRQVRALLVDEAAAGKAVLISTHNLAEVEAMAHQLLFLRQGKLVASGPTRSFREATQALVRTHDVGGTAHALREHGYTVSIVEDDTVAVDLEGSGTAQIGKILAGAGLYPKELTLRRRSLEEAYLAIVEGGADDE